MKRFNIMCILLYFGGRSLVFGASNFFREDGIDENSNTRNVQGLGPQAFGPCRPLPVFLNKDQGSRKNDYTNVDESVTSSTTASNIIDISSVVTGNSCTSQLKNLEGEIRNISKTVENVLISIIADTNRLQKFLKNQTLNLAESIMNEISTFVGSAQRRRKMMKPRRKKSCIRRKGKEERSNIYPLPFVNYEVQDDKGTECPQMFQKFWGKKENTCLWFSNITATWAEAMVYCDVMGAELAILDNWALRANVTKYMSKNAGEQYYLGGTEFQDEVWRWLKPRHRFPTTSPPWKKGKFGKSRNAGHCLAITRTKARYRWTNVRCDEKAFFICQREMAADNQ